MHLLRHTLSAGIMAVCAFAAYAAMPDCAVSSDVAEGYASTSVNNAVFRCNPLVTWGDRQYIVFYDADGYLTTGRRTLPDGDWTTLQSKYKAKVADGHNVASLGIDALGYLHVAFDHHGNKLKYCRSVAPGSLILGGLEQMTGVDEDDVTYPEFHALSGGDMLFAYRSGASGRGNLVLNRYDSATGRWSRVHDVLIDGEGARNAYWQLCTGADGTLHLSWVWRETWLVETNHDMCYARSTDGGKTWQRSDGTPQTLPITAANAEYAAHIPQGSDLINQTAMTADPEGHPYIVTYWTEKGDSVPQYRLIWNNGSAWHTRQVGHRTEPFSIAGGGTKMIPISRPRIIADANGSAWCIFRDAERGSKVSIAATSSLADGDWVVTDLTDYSVDAWEPTLDASRWQDHGVLSIFVQECHQGDGERTVDSGPTMVRVIDINPYKLSN